MTVPPSEVERRLLVFAQALRESGLRLTHQRLEVAREIARTDTHPHVETIYCGVRERVPTVSLDTVYRTLGALERLGLINRVDVMAGPARYDANLEHHHHFICARCGLIRDLPGTLYEGLEVPEAAVNLGEVESITVQLRGFCRECQEQCHGRLANPEGTEGDRR
jgi:Fur family transcriptional regulator, peroxide stress response regulator